MAMKLVKSIFGVLIGLTGAAAVAFGVYQTVTSTWEWLWLAIVGAGVALAGFSLALGAKRKEVVEMVRDTFGV